MKSTEVTQTVVEASSDYSNQTLTGKVTSLDGTNVTLLLGELTEAELKGKMQGMNGNDQQPPEMPGGGQQGNGQQPPEMPNGGQQGNGQQAPEIPNGGQQGGGQQPPEMPNGGQQGGGQQPPEMPNGGQQGDAQQPPEMPNGGQQPPEMSGGMMGGAMPTFTAGKETAVFDLKGAVITVESFPESREGTMEDITADAVITLEFGDKNTVKTVTVKNLGGMGGPSGMMGSQSAVEGQLGSWNMGDSTDYDYDAALFIGENGIDKDASDQSRLSGGSVTDSSADGLMLNDSASHHEAVVVSNADYSITNAEITMLTAADGSDTCDFSGIGSAIVVFGKSNVSIDNTKIETSGVATMPLFVDNGANVTVRNSTLVSRGGTLHSAYMNSPEQTVMVAPPWILGIMGTSRCSNLMGTNSTLNVIDSDTSAGAWAVLSTDAGTNMALNIVNTSLTLLNADESEAAPIQETGGQIYETVDNPYTMNYGSGYGTYAIGNANELFAGATLNVGTYATIMTGGTVTCQTLKQGETIELKAADGTVTTYTPTEDKATVINSDTFGFMSHQDRNAINLFEGTVVNSGYATFLVKTGSSNETLTANIDGTEIHNGGVLIQVMDNDDATNGGMMSADDSANTNGDSQNFISVHSENAGFSTRTGVTADSTQSFSFTNGTYSGNIYNASGSDQSAASNGLNAAVLNVSFGKNAVFNGAAASTSAIHVSYDGSMALKETGCFALDGDSAAAFADQFQNLSFDITHYFDIGQVANMLFYNGGNDIHITLADNAVWNVTSESLISSITIQGNAQVVIPAGITLTVNGNNYTNCVLTAESVL